MSTDDRIRLLEQLVRHHAARAAAYERIVRDLAYPSADVVELDRPGQILHVRTLVARARAVLRHEAQIAAPARPAPPPITESAARDHADREGWPRP